MTAIDQSSAPRNDDGPGHFPEPPGVSVSRSPGEALPTSAPNEDHLLARCLQSHSRAWDQLFDEHYPPATRFVSQLGHDFTREDVEEICQEAFLTVVRQLRSFKGKSRFQTWLFRIASNKARDYRQRRSAAKRGGGHSTLPLHNRDPQDGLPIDPPSSLPGPDLNLLNSEKYAQLGEAMEKLPPPCRQIIELRYFADLSYEEIARCLNLNQKTVSSRLSKSLDKLERILLKALNPEDQNSPRPTACLIFSPALRERNPGCSIPRHPAL